MDRLTHYEINKIIHLVSQTGGGDQHVEIATEKRGIL